MAEAKTEIAAAAVSGIEVIDLCRERESKWRKPRLRSTPLLSVG